MARRLRLARITISVLAALALQGCAINALRLEYAADVVSKSRTASASARDFLGRVDASRVAANLELIGLDPDCRPNFPYLLISPKIELLKDPRGPQRGWLCSTEEKAGLTHPTPISLAPLGGDLEPTFILIDALGAYASAINQIVETEGPDLGNEFTQATALARSAEALLRSIAGGAAIVPATSDTRLAAVGAFLTFVGNLANEQDKVKRLKVFTSSADGNGEIIASLRDHLSTWERSRKNDENLRYILAGTLLRQHLVSEPPAPAAQRKEIAKTYYDRAASINSSARFYSALDGALQELAAADADMRRILRDHPNLNPAERAKVAALTRQRVAQAFDTLTSLITSFRGA